MTLASLLDATNAQLLALIDRRHPEFKDSLDHWNFAESCYKGGRNWIEHNIFTYHKEGKTEFAERKKRAFRFPHSREVVSLVNKYVFKGSIERREDLPPHIKEFWGASTMLKRPIADLMSSFSSWTSTYGRIWVVVDNNVPTSTVTEEDRKVSKGRCYSYFIKPQLAFDFAYDDDGELEWFMNGELVRDDDDPLTSTGKVDLQYRVWTKEFWATVSLKTENNERIARVSDFGEHNIGVVPVFPADHLASEDLYASPGLIEDVAYLDRAVANYLSNLDVIIQDQTFSQLAIPYQGLLPSAPAMGEEDEDHEEANQVQVMGHKRVFLFNAEGGIAPSFISPDVKQAAIILTVITKIVGEIYHSIGMAGERTKEDNATGIDNSSGVAKAYDFERLNAMLAAKARSLQNIEKNLVRLVNAWNKDLKELEAVEDYVTYPETFDVRNLADEMLNAQRLSLLSAPKALRRLQMKRVVKKMFPQAADADVTEIETEIDGDWLTEPPPLSPGTPGAPGLPTPGAGRVPGKANTQGENNKGAPGASDTTKGQPA